MKIPTYEEILKMPIVRVVFDDHSTRFSDHLECEAYGRLMYEDKHKLVLITWVPDSIDAADMEHNWETATIIKGAVKKVERLRRVR